MQNQDTISPSRASRTAYAVCFLGCLLIFYALVKTMQYYTSPPPLNQARIDERKKALADLRAAEINLLNNYSLVDAARGIYRLPISYAMELTIREYQNPVAARSNLVFMSDKATAPLPQAPPPPNPFE